MANSSTSRLAYDLFSSVVVFNKDNEIVFAGDDILQILKKARINLFISKKGSPELSKFFAAVSKVRMSQKSSLLNFKKLDNEFILFPINYYKNRNVVLCLKNEIDRINIIERDLRERVKELECLYNISRELHTSKDLDIAFKNCTQHIKRGFQFPEATTVVIEFDGRKYLSKRGKEKNIVNVLRELIIKNNKKRGEIRVIYHENLPFLNEETNLLQEISGKFTRSIEIYERMIALEEQKKVLISKNKKLVNLTAESRQSRESLQAFFNAITDKIYVIDSDFNLILSNSDEIGNIGKCYRKVFRSAQVCKHCPALSTFKKSKGASLGKDFQNQHFLLQTYPIFNKDDKVDRIIEVCRDVTKEKKMESQLIESHKLASLGKLVAGVAHEINNPNTFILGNIKIIQEAFTDILTILDEKYKDDSSLKIARLNYPVFKDNIIVLVEDIYNGSVRMKKIVDDLRTFAKKDEGMLSDTVDLNSITENTIRLVKKQIKDNVKIILDLGPGIPTFPGSISKLEQVLMNMIINSSQAIEKETGEIRIQTRYNERHNQVDLCIKDNGKGMDEKTKSNIFDPFFTTKRNEGGIGLGLSISYGIIKEHKGDIVVSSEPGVGTSFLIHIPVN
jgi:signal transduction histidine kinase